MKGMWPPGAWAPWPMISTTWLRTDSREVPIDSSALGDPLTLVDEAEEDVLRPDVVLVEKPGFLLRQDDDSSGPLSV